MELYSWRIHDVLHGGFLNAWLAYPLGNETLGGHHDFLFKWIQQPKLGIIDWLLYPRDIVVDDWYTMYINNSSKNQIIDILEIIHQSGWLRWFISL